MSVRRWIRPSVLSCAVAVLPLVQDPRSPEEPLAAEFSFARGVAFLEDVAQQWGEQRKCVTCHTNGLALMAQPTLSEDSEQVARGRDFAARYLTSFLTHESRPSGQHGSLTGLVATTAFLALSDARTGLGLQPATRRGLDHAWQQLDESGAWEGWLKCNWPPFESDDEWGPALMLIALGELAALVGPQGLTEADQRGAERLQRWLRQHPPESMHGRAMRVWAARHWPGAARPEETSGWREQLVAAQAEDGGWSMAALAGRSWKRDGARPQQVSSEAYPTAFAVYVLLQTGTRRDSPVAASALAWLERNQRQSGAWFTTSPRRDGRHYISHAATAFALMALAGGQQRR